MPTRSSLSAGTSLGLLALLTLASSPALGSESAAAEALQPALLQVSVNGQRLADPLLLLQDGNGGLYASEAALRQWRIRRPAVQPVRYEGENYYRIDDLPTLRAAISQQDQSLRIEAGPALFERQSAAFGSTEPLDMTEAATGGFLNYDLFGEYFQGRASLNGAFEFGAFTSRGVGVSSFIVQAGSGGERLTRLETGWTIDRPSALSSIRIGDSVTAAGQGTAPLRFAGLQYARNFAVRPGFVTMPVPVLEGSAAVPSVVDVYVDNALQGSREVGPGPFELTNVPVHTGGGTVQLVVRDLLGRQVVSEHSYYASSALLRRGLHDFSYELGFLRRGFGVRSNAYGEPIASTAHRYGLTDKITLEGHLQASESRQVAGAGINLALFDLGLLGASASISRSERGTGGFLAAAFERRTSGFSFGLRSELASAGFAYNGMPDEHRQPRLTAQAFADLPVGGGALGFNLIHRDHRGRTDESLAGVFTNLRVSRTAAVQLFARRAVAGEAQTVLGAHLSLSLGGRRSASASVEYRGGSFSHHISAQDDAPPGVGSGFRTVASIGPVRSVETVFTHNFEAASLRGHVSRVGGSTGVRLSASGAFGLIGSRSFASRRLGSSFAAVKVGDYAGVRVYADNQLVGVTGEDGVAMVPSLRAFDRNMIRIEEGDLPIDAQIPETEIAVRPFARSGTLVSFEPRRERGVLMQVRLEDGSSLPAGASVTVAGGGSYVAVSGGEVYVPDLAGAAVLSASWGGGSCTFNVSVPENDDPQPRLTGLVCRGGHSYAAR